MRYIQRILTNKGDNKHLLLGTYISIILDQTNTRKLEYSKIKELLEQNFKYLASLEDINSYFESNYYENRLDIEQQMKNLNIRYD